MKTDLLLTLEQVCQMLSISVATGNNWLKLGKLIPSGTENQNVLFYQSYIDRILQEIRDGDSHRLKSRRNKRQVTGNAVYKDYIEGCSSNLSIIDTLSSLDSNLYTDTNICLLLAEYAVQLLAQALLELPPQGHRLDEFLDHRLDFGEHNLLVNHLLANINAEQPPAQLAEAFQQAVIFEAGQDFLGFAYISLTSLGQRKTTGTYYTPIRIVRRLIDQLRREQGFAGSTFWDPGCGTGNFLLYLSNYITHPSQLLGQDIDLLSVLITRLNLALNYPQTDPAVFCSNIVCKDSLVEPPGLNIDYIIGNPPWGYVYSQEQCASLIKHYATAQQRGIESYDLFLEMAIHQLDEGGHIAYILPEAILNVKAHKAVRKLLLSSVSFKWLYYAGNAFNGVQCPCILLYLQKTSAPTSVGCLVQSKNREFTISLHRDLSEEYIALNMSDQEYQCCLKIGEMPDKVYLKGQAEFALGIVTGDNESYLYDHPAPGAEPVLRGNDLYKYSCRPVSSYIHFQPKLFQQVAPEAIYRAPEKLLYRFICDRLVFAYDNRQTLSLNSANILIPHIEGLDIRYIMAILNSKAAEFYVKRKFNSVKILRAHIEQIPIPYVNRRRQRSIIEKIERIQCGTEPAQEIYESLDKQIMGLYQLNSRERQVIRRSLGDGNLFLP